MWVRGAYYWVEREWGSIGRARKGTHVGKRRAGERGGEDAPVERVRDVRGEERGGEGGGGLQQAAGLLHRCRHRMRRRAWRAFAGCLARWSCAGCSWCS